MLAGPVPLRVESCLIRRCSCNKYTCWQSATDTSTAAVQTYLLVECCCKMDTCWTVTTQSACLPIFWHSILHVHWCYASISAIHVPADVVPHYSYALRCGASLSAMPDSVLPHYRSCLLVWCLIIGHTFRCGASYRPCLMVWRLPISRVS